jgi:hypothetical protein
MNQHRAVRFPEDVVPDLDDEVRPYAEEVAIEGARRGTAPGSVVLLLPSGEVERRPRFKT